VQHSVAEVAREPFRRPRLAADVERDGLALRTTTFKAVRG